MPSLSEAPACLLCGATTTLLFPSNVRNGARIASSELACTSPYLSVHDDIFTCRQCELGRSMPPQDISELDGLYRDVHDTEYLESEPERRADFRKGLEEIERYPFVTKGSLLEIGSSVGLFLEEARSQGWEVCGIEPSRWATEHAAARGLTIFNGMLDDFDAEGRLFDVVASWDVLEHLQDPMGALDRAYELLKPGGLLVLTTVNMGGIMAKLLRGRWPWFMRMHLHYFTPKSLEEMVRRSGFEVLRISTQSKTLQLGYLLRRTQTMLGPIGRSAQAVAGWLRLGERPVRVNLGDILLVEARKP